MRFAEPSERLDLQRDLPTTSEDVAALRRVKNLPALDLEGYLRFLASLPPVVAANLAARRPPGDLPPFDLLG